MSLLADGDEPGHKAMQALAGHLRGLGCTVKIALPPTDGTDVADWIASEGVAGAGRKIATLMEDYIPALPAPEETQPLIPPEPVVFTETDLQDNPHYRLLGLCGDYIAVRLREAGRVLQRTRESMTQPATLIAIAPETWWCGMAGAEQLGSKTSRTIGDALIRTADSLGQIDLSMMWGRGAAKLPDGKVVYHLGDRLLVDGREVGLDSDPSQTWLAEPRVEMGKEATTEETAAIARAVMQYRWATPDDGKRMLGWIVAALVGGALEWRPHIILTAAAAEGKSWLLKHVVERIMGPLLVRVADATPAGVARLGAHSSLPLAIDEAEPSSPWVMELLKLLRIASGADGLRVRADQNGGVTTQQVRFSAMLSGTVPPMLTRPDASRLTPVRFGPPVDDWVGVSTSIQTAMKNADAVRYRILRRAPEIVAQADRLIGTYQELGMESREAMSSGALTAGWHFWGIDEKDLYANTEQHDTTDAADALLEILAVRHRMEGGVERSVLWLVQGNDDKDVRMLADLYGVKKHGNGLCIAIGHRGLGNAMSRTQWGNADIKQLLMQLPDVVESPNPLHFGSLRKRAIIIPPETLAEYGIDLDDGGTESD